MGSIVVNHVNTPKFIYFFKTGGQVVIKQNNSPPARCKLARKKNIRKANLLLQFWKIMVRVYRRLFAISLTSATNEKKTFYFFHEGNFQKFKRKKNMLSFT